METLPIASGEFCEACDCDDRSRVFESRLGFLGGAAVRWRGRRCVSCGTEWVTAELRLSDDGPPLVRR